MKTRRILLLLAAILLICGLFFLPHEPDGTVETPDFRAEPFLPGTQLRLDVSNRRASPESETFSARLPEERLFATLTAQYPGCDTVFVGRGDGEQGRWLLSIPWEDGGCDWFGLISYGQRREGLTKWDTYTIWDLGLRHQGADQSVKTALFPTVLLEEIPWHSTVSEDTAYPLIQTEADPMTLLRSFYERSPWYDLEQPDDHTLAVRLKAKVLTAQKELRTALLYIHLELTDGQWTVTLRSH